MKKQMKKKLALILAALLCFGAAGCSGKEKAETTAAKTTEAGTTKAGTAENGATEAGTAVAGMETVPETESAADNAAAMRIVTDAYGEQVEVPAQIDSIVATNWPYPALIYAVTGRTDMIKTMAEGSMEAYNISMFKVLAPGLEDLPTDCLDSGTDINFEELAKTEPDVVLCYKSVEEEIGEQIRAINAVPVNTKFGKFEDVQESIRLIGELFDCQDKAEKLVTFHKDTLAYLEGKREDQPTAEEKPVVLYITRENDGEYQVVCPTHLGANMVDLAGGRNATEEFVDLGSTTVSMEQILAWNPDIVLLSNFDDFTPEQFVDGTMGEEWSRVNAVKNQKVYKTPIGIYRWDTLGVETPLTVEWMAKVINPEVYREYDFQDELKDFYETYIDYTLTDSDLNLILNNSVNIYLDLNDDVYGKAE